MLEALIAGETGVTKLADLAQRRLRSKIPESEAALAGRILEHHRFMWREVLYHLDELNERLATLDVQIRHLTTPYEGIIERLDAIPGIDRRTAEVILAEIGPDVTPSISCGAAPGILGLSVPWQQHQWQQSSKPWVGSCRRNCSF